MRGTSTRMGRNDSDTDSDGWAGMTRTRIRTDSDGWAGMTRTRIRTDSDSATASERSRAGDAQKGPSRAGRLVWRNGARASVGNLGTIAVDGGGDGDTRLSAESEPLVRESNRSLYSFQIQVTSTAVLLYCAESDQTLQEENLAEAESLSLLGSWQPKGHKLKKAEVNTAIRRRRPPPPPPAPSPQFAHALMTAVWPGRGPGPARGRHVLRRIIKHPCAV